MAGIMTPKKKKEMNEIRAVSKLKIIDSNEILVFN